MDHKTKYLRGKSIDGTVYYGFGGWTSDIYEAEQLTPEQANLHMSIRIGINNDREVDEKIGQLQVIAIPDFVQTRIKLVEYLCDGNTKEDLAHQLLGMIEEADKHAYNELIAEMVQVNATQEQNDA